MDYLEIKELDYLRNFFEGCQRIVNTADNQDTSVATIYENLMSVVAKYEFKLLDNVETREKILQMSREWHVFGGEAEVRTHGAYICIYS